MHRAIHVRPCPKCYMTQNITRTNVLSYPFLLPCMQNNSCFINRYCFAPNETSPLNWCYQCLPEVSTNSWTRRQGDNKHCSILLRLGHSNEFCMSSVLQYHVTKLISLQHNIFSCHQLTCRLDFHQSSNTSLCFKKLSSYPLTL